MGKVLSFLKEARAELSKVVWPTRRRAAKLASIVVVVTLLFGAFIGGVDYGLAKGMQAVIGLTKPQPAAPIDQLPGGQPGDPVEIPAGQAGLPAGAEGQPGQPAGGEQPAPQQPDQPN